MGSVVQLGQVATGRIWHSWGRWQLEGSEQLGQVVTSGFCGTVGAGGNW